MGTELDVRRADKSDFDALMTALSTAAPDEAVTEWMMRGHPAKQFLDVYLPEIIERGLAEDEIWVAGAAGEIWAVSVWQAVDSVERLHAEAATVREQADRAPDVVPLQRSAYVTELLAREHPRRFPHRYLELIVTVPQYRGRGAGAAILGHRTRALAAAGMPAYLEASTERSSRLYARHGFVRIGEPFSLPEDGPTLIPMWFEA
ncbi:GNAT family N-acetyltransferase [Nocardia flavorosea]|uniref:GNAT family N-acetyltransferase n=1 Tax=Nocardia flavorosea TaxID=53429 RepID=UPI002B4B3F36|nr:GNAT family N-acetyltransferase [Nocardia flavorosea]